MSHPNARPPHALVLQGVKSLLAFALEDRIPAEDRVKMEHWEEIGHHPNAREKWVQEAVWSAGEYFFMDAPGTDDGSMSDAQFDRQMEFWVAVNDEALRQGVIGCKAQAPRGGAS